MTMQAYRLRLYTPLFSYGANQQVPEIRAASIRGVLHWWFRALGGTFEQEREIFGGISLGNNHPLARRSPESAARLVLRTSIPEFRSRNYARLPHKEGGQDRKRTRLNSSHVASSNAVFCLYYKKDKRVDVADES